MIPKASNTMELILLSKKEDLYRDLIQQIQKDFEMTGIKMNLVQEDEVSELINKLENTIAHLIHTQFDLFLQLLYRIDVSETNIINPSNEIEKNLVQKAIFSILKREWQKVFFRREFG